MIEWHPRGRVVLFPVVSLSDWVERELHDHELRELICELVMASAALRRFARTLVAEPSWN